MRGRSGANEPRRLDVGHEPMGDQSDAWPDDSDANSSKEDCREGSSGGEGVVKEDAPREATRIIDLSAGPREALGVGERNLGRVIDKRERSLGGGSALPSGLTWGTLVITSAGRDKCLRSPTCGEGRG
jgi:hypothetical protein